MNRESTHRADALAARIDHTLLRADASSAELERLCDEAIEIGFASVCVHPCWVPLCAQRLHGFSPCVCTVIGFPYGATDASVKLSEARWALAAGARELDVVLALWALKSGSLRVVRDELAAIVAAADGSIVKVILETALLSTDEKRVACELAVEAGASFVKTSTGVLAGATVEDVQLLRKLVGPSMGVKASGGIRDRQAALDMVAAGADRIGTSRGVSMFR